MEVEHCPQKYELEEENLCIPNKNQPKLDQFIKNIIDCEGFLIYNIEKKCVSTNGGNYLGTLYEIDVTGNTREGDTEINLFVKNIVQGDETKLISVAGVYETELFAYKELSKIFTQLQDEANVPSDVTYKMVKCYDESNEKTIIMENIAKKGYSTGHRMDVITLKFAEIAIKELAKFHALSFALKEKRPSYFEKQIKTMKIPYIFCEGWKGFMESMLNISTAYIDEDYKERVEKFCTDIYDRFRTYYEDKRFMRCLCHGDYKPNNIMTKITNGEIADIRLVDYQLLYYGCPVIDFFYFIFASTDREFRKAHLSHLKDLYFEALTQFLKFFDIDVNIVYPRKEFDMDYKANIDYGLVSSLILTPFMFASEDDVPDIVDTDMSTISFNLDDRFKDKIRDVIEDYIEWGFI